MCSYQAQANGVAGHVVDVIKVQIIFEKHMYFHFQITNIIHTNTYKLFNIHTIKFNFAYKKIFQSRRVHLKNNF